MKNSLPTTAKVSKEAKECVQECVSEFISFIVSNSVFGQRSSWIASCLFFCVSHGLLL